MMEKLRDLIRKVEASGDVFKFSSYVPQLEQIRDLLIKLEILDEWELDGTLGLNYEGTVIYDDYTSYQCHPQARITLVDVGLPVPVSFQRSDKNHNVVHFKVGERLRIKGRLSGIHGVSLSWSPYMGNKVTLSIWDELKWKKIKE